MLEYTKTILLKVSFDTKLFEKELRKGLKLLQQDELQQLRQWCYSRFSDVHLLVLSSVFLNSTCRELQHDTP